jgi:hypothetical protein
MDRPQLPTEPSPHRDIGPYESAEQARAQLNATVYGIPAGHAAPGFAGELTLMEALSLAGIEVSGWEDTQRQDIVRALSPEAAQVIARLDPPRSCRRPGPRLTPPLRDPWRVISGAATPWR